MRQYLTICTPFAIETDINSTITVFQQVGPGGLIDKPPLLNTEAVGRPFTASTSIATRPQRGPEKTTIDPEIAKLVEDKPKIDLEITFDYNSADISAKSIPSVQALGRALTNADLKGSTFVVAGHTDAAGGEEYNQSLSERRADAIKKYLVDKYGINGSDLVTVGYGKSKLKDANQPLAEANRRVQVVNMENKTTAQK